MESAPAVVSKKRGFEKHIVSRPAIPSSPKRSLNRPKRDGKIPQRQSPGSLSQSPTLRPPHRHPLPPPRPSHAPLMTSSPPRRRRGRQPRPSLLSSRVKTAVAAFALQVGQPRVIEPAGFRDFRGWLSFIGGPAAIPAWAPLVDAVLRDTGSDIRRIDAIKQDLVREVVKAVVIPREGESSKLVSTNCGRQCARPLNGVTLMTILDRLFGNIRQWKEIIPAVANAQSGHAPLHYSRSMPASGASTNDPYSASTSTPPKLVYPSTSEISLYSNEVYSVGVSQQDDHDHYSSPTTPRSQATTQQYYQRYAASSRDHTNSRAPQGRQEDVVSGSRPLPSFQELEDSLQTPSYLVKRAKR